MTHMDDLYGTDPVADDAKTRTPPHMLTPCYVCRRPVDTTQEHTTTHPWGRSKPERVLCSDACFADYAVTQQRERDRLPARP